MKAPSLSIITPSYNSERYIERCIRDVIAQGCLDEVEHLIVDGKSSDQTVVIVERYAQKYPHIRYISQKDAGQSDAMNNGIHLARAPVISFLNVDDYYEPGTIREVLALLPGLREPGMLVGNCYVRYPDGTIRDRNRPRCLRLIPLLLKFPFPINPSAYFYHKSLHDKIGLYNVHEHYVLDLDFILRAVQVAHIKYVDRFWGNFLWIEGSKTFSVDQAGKIGQNNNRLLDHYAKQLPVGPRLLVGFLRTMQKGYWQFKYYWHKLKKIACMHE